MSPECSPQRRRDSIRGAREAPADADTAARDHNEPLAHRHRLLYQWTHGTNTPMTGGTMQHDVRGLRHHSIRNAVFVAAIAGLASALRRDHGTTEVRRPPRIGETALGEPGEVLWYC